MSLDPKLLKALDTMPRVFPGVTIKEHSKKPYVTAFSEEGSAVADFRPWAGMTLADAKKGVLTILLMAWSPPLHLHPN